MEKDRKGKAVQPADPESPRAALVKRIITIAVVVIIVCGAVIQVCARHGVKIINSGRTKSRAGQADTVITEPEKKTFEEYLLKTPSTKGIAEGVRVHAKAEACDVRTVSNNGMMLSDVYYVTDRANGIEQIRLRYGLEDRNSKLNLTVHGRESLEDAAGNKMLGIMNTVTDNFNNSCRSRVITINLAGSKYEGCAGKSLRLKLYAHTTDFAAEYLITVPGEEEIIPFTPDFDNDGINKPYVQDVPGNEGSRISEKICKTAQVSNNGIKLSNVYYITDEDNNIEQVRFRYSAGSCDLAESGRVAVFAEYGEQMVGITTVQNDNYNGQFSQTVTINFAESGYAGVAGKRITLDISVANTECEARYAVIIPEPDTAEK